jgi:sigma-B regulation protein RsbU (phosphoserine phosphatase)
MNEPRPNWFERLRQHAQDFWRRVTEGLTLQELWTQFRKETTVGYRSYARGVEPADPDEKKSKRAGRVLRELFWATLAKLTPVRRLLLLIGLILWLLPLLGLPLILEFYAAAILLAILGLELADRVAMKRDMQIARDIQKWLLPHEPPPCAEADMAFAALPANTVAGDYLDIFFRHTNGSTPASPTTSPIPPASPPLFFAVADVAGKSVPAALLSATLQASLRTAAYEAASLADLVARLNSYACDHSLDGRRFTTGVFAELEPETGALAYVNAGHNPPILRRANGDFLMLEAGGLPLGIERERGYECRSLALQPGDLLVLYTDGVVEAENENREEYGEARLRAVLQSSGGAEAPIVLERILKSVETFLGVAPQGDDITCFVMRYRGKP